MGKSLLLTLVVSFFISFLFVLDSSAQSGKIVSVNVADKNDGIIECWNANKSKEAFIIDAYALASQSEETEAAAFELSETYSDYEILYPLTEEVVNDYLDRSKPHSYNVGAAAQERCEKLSLLTETLEQALIPISSQELLSAFGYLGEEE